MFRTSRYPVGVMARSRLDWSLDLAMVGQVETTSSGANMPYVSLYNNAHDGTNLAVVALLVWSSAPIPIAWMNLLAGTNGVATGTPATLYTKGTGTYGVTYATTAPQQPSGSQFMKFAVDGKTWIERQSAPLTVLQPGWRAEIFVGVAPGGVISRPTSLVANFIWVPI